MVNIIFHYYNGMNFNKYSNIIRIKESLIEEEFINIKNRADTASNFYHTKVYEYSLSLLKLKHFHISLLEVLDPIFEQQVIEKLEKNIKDLDDALLEISFLNKTSPNPTSELSIIDKVYIDESKFSKN